MPLNPSAARLPVHDPAWLGRLFWCSLALLLLWPLGVATEFRPWTLLEPQSLAVTGHFLGDFFPPRLNLEFLQMVARESWRTVAIATVGVSLALLAAAPLALVATRVLSVSALTGRMARGPVLLRLGVRWLLIVLRSVPELVWALVFVRVVGLGVTAGVLAIALTYTGMLGQGVHRNTGKRRRRTHTRTVAQRRGPGAGVCLRLAAAKRRRTEFLHRLSLGMRDPLLGGTGFCRRRRSRSAIGFVYEDV